MVPGRTPSLDSPSEKWNGTFAYHHKGYQFFLIGLLLIVRCRYPLNISNVIKRRNGSFEKLHWTSASRRLFLTSGLNNWVRGGGNRISSDGDDWRMFLELKLSIQVFFRLGKFWFAWGFFAYSKHSEVVILHNVVDETEDVLGCLECVLGFFGFC